MPRSSYARPMLGEKGGPNKISHTFSVIGHRHTVPEGRGLASL